MPLSLAYYHRFCGRTQKIDDRLEAYPTEDSLPFEAPQVDPPGQRSLGRRAIRPRRFELDR